MNIEDLIKKIADRWFMREPLLFMTLMSHRLEPSRGLLNPIRSGQGRIEYRYDYEPNKLSESEFEELLRAEAIRILLRHPYRHHGNRAVAYKASNITLNENYKFENLKYTVDSEFGETAWKLHDQSFEVYYHELLKQQQNSQSAEAADGSALWDDDEMMGERIKELIEQAEQSKSWGTLSGDLVQTLIASLRPELDYRKVLNGFRATVIASRTMLTRFKPSRRYGYLQMGKKSDFTTRLLVAMDVSGSIADDEIRLFYSAVNRFFKYGIENIDVLQFDTDVKGEPLTMKKAQREIRVTGRGGTLFQPVIDYFSATRKHYDGLIIFTDGYAPQPHLTPALARKTLWICNNARNYREHSTWMQKSGRCCWIKD